ncbi:MAG: carbohydrate ABC transporter permease [Oscillospiraceae bacterium]|nr:carbohydrate ABC transporter permease [Oscillospiraceae bacterium]
MKKRTSYTTTKMSVQILTYAALILFLLISILPIYWMWQASLAPRFDLIRDPFSFPGRLTFENLQQAWLTGRMGDYFFNSVFVAIVRVSGVLFLSCLAGYAFGKLKFAFRDIIFRFMLFGMMIPISAMIIPIYYNISRMGLINNRFGIILPYFGLSMPFATFMMRSFFRDLPTELMDASRVDGCNEFSTFFRVMLPLVMPAVTSLLVFEFMWSWNDFFLPMMIIYRDSIRTLPLGLMYFSGKYTANYSLLAAGVTICSLPIIVIYTIFQRKFVEGLTSGAVKG